MPDAGPHDEVDEDSGRAHAEVARTHRLLAVLTELGNAPVAEEPARAADRIAHLLVPRVVDGCVVEIDDLGPGLAAAAHVDPRRTAALLTDDVRAEGLHVALVTGAGTAGRLTVWLENARSLAPVDLRLVRAAARQLAGTIERQRLRTLVDHFLTLAAHELRTPLQAIALGVDLVRARLHGAADEVPRDWLVGRLDRTGNEVARMRLLVETLLDATDLPAGRALLRREPVDLGAVVAQVLERLDDQISWARSACTVEVSGPTDGLWDRVRVELVVTNLITNALKVGAEGPIRIALRGDGHSVRLTVNHEGLGSFGLGLWTVKPIVNALGGSANLATNPATGSTFTVSLPRSRA